jgi:hypothetical protein
VEAIPSIKNPLLESRALARIKEICTLELMAMSTLSVVP